MGLEATRKAQAVAVTNDELGDTMQSSSLRGDRWQFTHHPALTIAAPATHAHVSQQGAQTT